MPPDPGPEAPFAGALTFRRAHDVARGRPIRLFVDGAEVAAFEGESLGVALAASGRLTLRRSPNAGAPRGMFCLMGVCQECVVEVDGALTSACVTAARDGMVVATDVLSRARDMLGGAR